MLRQHFFYVKILKNVALYYRAIKEEALMHWKCILKCADISIKIKFFKYKRRHLCIENAYWNVPTKCRRTNVRGQY